MWEWTLSNPAVFTKWISWSECQNLTLDPQNVESRLYCTGSRFKGLTTDYAALSPSELGLASPPLSFTWPGSAGWGPGTTQSKASGLDLGGDRVAERWASV